jgi:antitoxin component YwqK of YwqJK toxin-antitoxin module
MSKPAQHTTNGNNVRFSRIDFYRLNGLDLYQSLYRAISNQLGEGKAFAANWAKLTGNQQGFHAWWGFSGEVQNGGLVQYFFNDGNRFVPALQAFLVRTGNDALVKLVEQASATYQRRKAEFAGEPWGKDGVFARIGELNDLDDKAGRWIAKSNKTIEKWFRANPTELVVGDDGNPIDPTFTGKIETHHANGALFEQAQVRRGKLTGEYRRYFDDGTLDYSEFYKGGELSHDFWPNGQPKTKKMKRGDTTVIEWYYPSGRLQKRYVKGKSGYPVEPIRLWHENGQLAEELHVKESDEFGPWLQFFDDGSPRLQAEHGEDRKLMVHNAWNDNHEHVVTNGTGTFVEPPQTINWEFDVFNEHYSYSSMCFRGGILHGMWRVWSKDGPLMFERCFKDGVLDGERIDYYDNGRIESRTTYEAGKEIRSEEFPKFDNPKPAVLINVESTPKLYAGWKMQSPHIFPRAKNLEEIRRRLVIPQFLQEVFERNLMKNTKNRHEDIDSFDEWMTYFVEIDDQGSVQKVDFRGCSPYSISAAADYPPLIQSLRFEPARRHDKNVASRAIFRVRHTFVEAESSSPPTARST